MTTKTTNTNTDPMAVIKQRALELALTTTGKGSKKTPKACACGCGLMTKGGTWMPGHDAKMLSRLLSEARAKLATPTPAPTETEPESIKCAYCHTELNTEELSMRALSDDRDEPMCDKCAEGDGAVA